VIYPSGPDRLSVNGVVKVASESLEPGILVVLPRPPEGAAATAPDRRGVR